MRRDFLIGGLSAALCAGLPRPAAAQAGAQRFVTIGAGRRGVDHAVFDVLLARYLRTRPDGVNRVDYAAWKASAADLRSLSGYIATLEQTEVASLSRAEQFAYWANLYNAATLRVVLERYPVKSIREIKPNLVSIGPWKTKVVTVGGTALSLDDMEHGILRRRWRDPRIHYAVNCASIGCPNLRRKALTGATLEADLTDAARDYVNHPRGAAVVDGKLIVSSIYRWYEGDFGGSDAGVIAHLRSHADAPLKTQLAGVNRVDRHVYDWSLNDVARR